MRSTIACGVGLALLAFAAPAAGAPPAWAVVPAKSRIGFSGVYSGNKFTGTVGKWAATIRFDPVDLAASKVLVMVVTSSVNTGDKFQDTTLAGAEWFDPGQFPRATYTTTRIAAAGPGRYIADGTLTVKGKAVPVRLPFTLRIAGDTATMAGSLTLDRIALGLGTQSDPSGEWVSKPIALTIELTAQKMK